MHCLARRNRFSADHRPRRFSRWLSPTPGRLAVGLLLAAALVLAGATGAAAQSDDPMQGIGDVPRHASFSLLPWEHIDLYTGNGSLAFTDLVLPGNGGFNLAIQRVYSMKDAKWRWSVAPEVTSGGCDTCWPAIVQPSGSTEYLFVTSDPNVYLTPSMSRFTRGIYPVESTLEQPDGTVWHFANQSYAAWMEDPFGNRVEVFYQDEAVGAVSRIVQHVGSQTREVTFHYDANGNPDELRYGNHLWRYRWAPVTLRPFFEVLLLVEVTPPEGGSWTFDYTDTFNSQDLVPWHEASVTVHTPGGAWVRYDSATGPKVPGDYYTRDDEFMVRRRESGGGGTSPGTWTFNYGDGIYDPRGADAGMTTIILGPSGFSATYLHAKVYVSNIDASDQDAPLREVTTGGQTTTYEWRWSYPLGMPEPGSNLMPILELPLRITTTREGHVFRREFSYEDASYNHFGQPSTITDTGDFTRTTALTYRHFDGRWLADRVNGRTIDNGFPSTLEYDDQGFLYHQTVLGVSTSRARNAAGNVVSATDGNGNTTTFDYDWGVVSAIHTPLGFSAEFGINSDGTTAWARRRGQTTTFQSEALRRTAHPPVGNDTVTTYAADGRSATVSTGASWTTTYLDGFGRATGTLDSQGVRTRLDLDVWGRTTYASNPYTATESGGTSIERDGLGRIKKTTNADGSTVTYTYDGLNVTMTDEEGHQTTQVWQASGSPSDARLHSVTDANGQTTTYRYNAVDAVERVTQPNPPGPTIEREWHYNTSSNQVEWQWQPESGTTTYSYYPGGNVHTVTDTNNRVTTYTYDANGRLTHLDFPDGTYTNIGYDESDNRIHLANPYVTSDFVFDAADRLTKRTDVINGRSFITEYTPDGNGNIVDVKYPSFNHVHYAYDSEDRLISVTDPTRGLTFATAITYGPSGDLASYTSGDGVSHTFEYDSRLRPRRIVANGVFDLTYDYDRVGNVTTLWDGRRDQFDRPMTATFGYDNIDRLTSATGGGWGSLTYHYDAVGNRTQRTGDDGTVDYHYTAENRLGWTSGVGAQNFSYYDNGNLHTNALGTYTYTPANMLETASVANGNALYTYRYDGDNQRAMKIVGSGATVTYYVNGLSEFEELADQLKSVDYVYAGSRLLAAVHNLPTYRVTVTKAGTGSGLVTDGSGTISCGAGCTSMYAEGTVVTLTATVAPGSRFVAWSGACSGAWPVATITMGHASVQCTATFATVPHVDAGDLDGDGKADLVWRNTSTGQTTVWLMNGNMMRSETVVQPAVTDPAWRIVATGDFNHDGRPDFVWRNMTTGVNTVWFMDGTTFLDWTTLSAVPDPDWRIVGTGDFNGDGNTDLVWRKASTGGNSIWYMNGTNVAEPVWFASEGDLSWRLVGVGDFNLDGMPDLVWRNATTGANRIWYMNGAEKSSEAPLPSEPDGNWQIVSVGDFNGDWYPDLVWQNAASGAGRVWYMRGAAKTGDAALSSQSNPASWVVGTGRVPPPAGWSFAKLFPPAGGHLTGNGLLRWAPIDGVTYEICIDTVDNNSCDTSWQPVGLIPTRGVSHLAAGTYYWQVRGNGNVLADNGTWSRFTFTALNDFDGDGKSDIVWRNIATNEDVLWYMDGTAKKGEAPFTLVPVSDFRIVATGDFNGDGKVDLIWRNVVNGSTTVWYMNGPTMLDWGTIPTVTDPNWRIGGAGDFDGDGISDLLWHNVSSGQNTIWFMNGANYRDWGGVSLAMADSAVRTGAVADFNGDGKADIVWRNTTTGDNLVWYMDGLAVVSSTRLPVDRDPAWLIVGAGDYNGDHKPDLLWRNLATGAVRVWFMDNATKLGEVVLPSQANINWIIGTGTVAPASGWAFGKVSPAPGGVLAAKGGTLRWALVEGVTYEVCIDTINDNACNTTWQSTGLATRLTTSLAPGTYYWQVRGNGATYADSTAWWSFKVAPAGDFDASGGPDLVWRNLQTGADYVWFMNGVSKVGEASYGALTDPLWRVVAVGDFNGDGKADLVWRHLGNASTTVWLMNGMTIASWAGIPAVTDQNWRISAAADFNGDGKTDIVWQHVGLGMNTVWYMDGVTLVDWTGLDWEYDTNWRIVGAADFDGDNRPDMVWRNVVTGENRLWYMVGATKTDVRVLPAEPDVNWQIVALGDYNGDGRSDLVWRNAMTGANRVWYMDNDVKLGEGALPSQPDLNWVLGPGPVPPAAGWGIGKILPAAGIGGLSADVTFSWGFVEGVTYELCVDTTNNGTCDTAWEPLGLGTTRRLTLAPGTYYWQVRGNGSTYADSSTWWSFSVAGEPEPLALAAMAPPIGPSSAGRPIGVSKPVASTESSAAAPLILVLAIGGVGWLVRRSARPASGLRPCVIVARRVGPAVGVLVLVPAVSLAQSGPVVEYYHTDAVGSVRAVTKVVNGQLQVERHDFDPFGREIAPQNPQVTKFLFTGQERDAETGFYHFQARFLSTDDGRFTTPDPGNVGASLGDPQSWNLYGYVRNNPLRFVDPQGTTYQVCMKFSDIGCHDFRDEDWLPYLFGGVCAGCRIVGDFSNGYAWAMKDGYDQVVVTWAWLGPDRGSDMHGQADPVPASPGSSGNSAASSPQRPRAVSCKAASPSLMQYAKGFGSAALMFAEFVTGLGPRRQTFGPGSAESQLMASSVGVKQAVNGYLTRGQRVSLYTFRAGGVLAAGANPIQQYVGSYTYAVTPGNGGLYVTIRNTTSVWSGSYHVLPSHERYTFRPLGTTSQIYQVFVPCR